MSLKKFAEDYPALNHLINSNNIHHMRLKGSLDRNMAQVHIFLIEFLIEIVHKFSNLLGLFYAKN